MCPPAALAIPAAVVPEGGCPLRHWLASAAVVPEGGLPFWLPVAPAFSFVFAPYPPTPFPGGEGGDQSYFMQGASPLASPGAEPERHLQSQQKQIPGGGAPGGTGSTCRSCPRRGAYPRRHWFALPRGRGPSQTPKFLSPGPPSPWLPALLTSAASQPARL